VYVLEERNKSKFNWVDPGKFKLNQKIAYGASVSTANGIICIGGENEKGISRSVFLLQWDAVNKKIMIKNLPDLPLAMTNMTATVNKKIVYIAGGEILNGVSDQFYSLDLNKISEGWKRLPVLPKPISHAVMVVQSNGDHSCIYLIGGRKKNTNGISDLYFSVYEFDLKKNEWKEKKSLPYALSAGTAIANGTTNILLFGGDKGETFHQTEILIAAINAEKDETKKQELIQQKNKLQRSHPGFSNEVLSYNTFKDEWKLIDKIPAATPVTTTAVKWGNRVFIPSGEIKAGVRTPQILMGKVNRKNK
jgi:N-acetylneuraminic acid mutarotase